MKKSEIHDYLKTNQDARGIAHWKKHKEKSGGLMSFGVGLTRLRKFSKTIEQAEMQVEQLQGGYLAP